jgi:hypothetical protein
LKRYRFRVFDHHPEQNGEENRHNEGQDGGYDEFRRGHGRHCTNAAASFVASCSRLSVVSPA